MAKRFAAAHFLSALLPLILAVAFALPGSSQVAGHSNGILLSVEKGETSRDFWVEPIAVLNRGEFERPPDSCGHTSPEAQRFQSLYFKSGRTYQLLFGGTRAGTITISPPIGNFSGGIATLNGSLVLDDGEMALATNASNLGNGDGYRRAPAPEERAAAEEFAKRMFRSTGSQDESLRRMKIDSLTVTQLFRGAEPALIGTATVAGEGISKDNRFLFFAATKGANDDAYTPSFIWYNHPGSDAKAEKLQLVDVVDLDGDGINDLVVLLGYSETHRFQIYKFGAGNKLAKDALAWQKIYESGLLGCK